MPLRIEKEKENWIKELAESGISLNKIAKITKSAKRTVKKYLKLSYIYPPIKIPPNMRETQYSGYYITENGEAYRKPGKYDNTRQHGEINEYGLIYLKPAFRGHPNYKESQYECINISLRDKNGKFIKQIKKSIHQLVAETFIDNPHRYTEVLHLDGNNRNNHYKNLKWGTHKENMKMIGSPKSK